MSYKRINRLINKNSVNIQNIFMHNHNNPHLLKNATTHISDIQSINSD